MSKILSMLFFGIIFIMLVWGLGCGDKFDPIMNNPSNDDDDDDNNDDDDNGENITYTQHIKSLLDQNCIRCHSSANQGADRNGAPPDVNLDTYEGAVTSAMRANARIQGGTMPPTGGLSSDDRALFQAWIDQGLLE